MKRSAQISTVAAFLLVIFGVPVVQAIVDLREQDGELQVKALFERPPTEENLRQFEKGLEENSYVEQRVRPLFQKARYRLLGDLGEKALRGTDGWLFYAPGLEYLIRPDPRDESAQGAGSAHGPAVALTSDQLEQEEATDPVAAIVDFRDQLHHRKIRLLVIPIPGKASIYPDRLVAGLKPHPAIFRHTRRLLDDLRARGVEVLELHEVFLAARERHQLYMKSDTHWSGEGVRLAAATIAHRVRSQSWYWALKQDQRQSYTRAKVRVEREGDIPKMTRIPNDTQLFPKETVETYRVFDAVSKQPYEDGDESPVLFLGDSFSRIYQTDAPEAAGLIANLAYELKLPLVSVVNDGGASTLVRQELVRYPELLEGVRLVIWAFIERDIRFGMRGWQLIHLSRAAPPPATLKHVALDGGDRIAG